MQKACKKTWERRKIAFSAINVIMARSEKQKLKLVMLLDILKKHTDEEHGITMPQIISELEKESIRAERKALYADIKLLQDNGYDIVGEKIAGNYEYRLLDREFELPELKLLIDAVQVSKFISQKRSNELIKKIEALASDYQASELHRQVYVTNRIKTSYDSTYYNIDGINMAINKNSQIDFDYYEWTLDKKMEIRPNGNKTGISPWALTWDDENYYLVAYEDASGQIKHYRVDKMRNIKLTDKERDGKEEFGRFDMAVYAKKVFNMFTGETTKVKMEFDNQLIGVVIDRFGKDIMIIPSEKGKFIINADVNVSNMFFGWIVGLGSRVKILEPESVVKKMKQEIERLSNQYH